jgi:hypothetical protein
MSPKPSRDDYESTGQWMVAMTIWQKIEDYGLDPRVPDVKDISDAIDRANAGNALAAYIGAAWDAASEIVYDMFPQYREPFEEE